MRFTTKTNPRRVPPLRPQLSSRPPPSLATRPKRWFQDLWFALKDLWFALRPSKHFRPLICLEPHKILVAVKANRRSDNHRFGLDVRVGSSTDHSNRAVESDLVCKHSRFISWISIRIIARLLDVTYKDCCVLQIFLNGVYESYVFPHAIRETRPLYDPLPSEEGKP
jgi:hypothetical protein